MKKKLRMGLDRSYVKRIALLSVLVALVTVGCSVQSPAVIRVDDGASSRYSGELRANYADALDVADQLALGTLRLEETTYAVTEAQAAEQLPLWQALQGTVMQSQNEQLAVTKQIEATLTEAQVSAIAAMQLTQADAQAWLQEQDGGMAAGDSRPGVGGARGTGGGQGAGGIGANMSGEDRAAMREQFQNLSDEERAEMLVQFTQQAGANGAAAGAATTSRSLIRAVTLLLAERSGQGQVVAARTRPQQGTEIETTATPAPNEEPTATPIAQITLVPWKTPQPTPEPTEAEASEATTVDVTSAASNATASADVVQTAAQTEVTAAVPVALEWVPDTDPGPPLTVQITTNFVEPNPLLEGGLIYNVGGFIYNPTDEAYTITAVHVTFFDADGFRGAFYPFPTKSSGRGAPSGEYIWHGAMEADVTCTLLGPGESCPFTAEIAAQNMASFLVHPDAVVTEWHEPVSSVALRRHEDHRCKRELRVDQRDGE